MERTRLTEGDMHPHPVAFFDEFVFWGLIFLSPFIVWVIYSFAHDLVALLTAPGIIETPGGFKEFTQIVVYCMLYVTILLTLGVVLAVKKISMGWAALMFSLSVLVLAAGFLLRSSLENLKIVLMWTIGTGSILGIVSVELKRKHIFYRVEKDGVLAGSRSFFSEKYMFYRYSHIAQICHHRTFAEKLFGCGTLILIPSSGMNLGYDTIRSGLLHFFIGTEHTRTLPRSMPIHSMFSVKSSGKIFLELRSRMGL